MAATKDWGGFFIILFNFFGDDLLYLGGRGYRVLGDTEWVWDIIWRRFDEGVRLIRT